LEVNWKCKISFSGKPAKYMKTPALEGFIRLFFICWQCYFRHISVCAWPASGTACGFTYVL